MATWGSNQAYEVNGSRTETYTRSELTAKVTVICPWDSRFAVMSAISLTKYPLPAGASQIYYDAYPKSMDASVYEEVGLPSDVYEVSYSKAKIDITYICKSKSAADLESSITETVTPILNMRRLSTWGFYWASDGSPALPDESPAMLQIQIKIVRQITGVSQIPAWFWSLAGCVNQNAWTDIFTQASHDIGTLLFIPSSLSKQITVNPEDIDNVWDIGFELMWNPIGWNKFQRPHGIDSLKFGNQNFEMYQPKLFLFK